MTGISALPDDILSSAFDWLSARQLLVAAHVCHLWRILALEHQTFWGQATIDKSLDSPPEVDFFLARLSRAQVGQRPVEITIEPNRLVHPPPAWTPRQVSIMRMRIIPAISAALSHISSLTLELPAVLAESMFDALGQPAPALRRLTIANRPQQGSVLLPLDIFAGHAPALVELVVGGDVRLPADPVPAFRGVQKLELLDGRWNLEISDIFERFPSVHHINTLRRRTESLGTLNPQQLDRLNQLESLGLDVSLLSAMDQSHSAWKPIASIRRLGLQRFERSARLQPVTDHVIPRILMPPSARELHSWVQPLRMRVMFPSESGSGLPFVRTVYGSMASPEQGRMWAEVCAYSALVTLAVDIEVLNTLRGLVAAFPSLEALRVTLRSQLPRYMTLPLRRPIACARLRTVLFENQTLRGKPLQSAIVTCRGTDEFLRASFAVGDWEALDVILMDVSLYGNATAAHTRIPGVRTLSKQECTRLGARIAILLDDTDM